MEKKELISLIQFLISISTLCINGLINIIIKIHNKFNIKLSKATIYCVLHKHNLTYKKLIVKNIPYDDDKIINLKNDLKNKFNGIKIDKLISYDEMSIYLNDKPYRGWSIKGKECFIKTKNKTIFNNSLDNS